MVCLRDGCKVVNHKGKVGLEEHGGRISEGGSGTNALGDGRLDASHKDLEEMQDESGDHEGRPEGPDNGVAGPSRKPLWRGQIQHLLEGSRRRGSSRGVAKEDSSRGGPS